MSRTNDYIYKPVRLLVLSALIYIWVICYIYIQVAHIVTNSIIPTKVDLYIFSIVMILMCWFDTKHVMGGAIKQLKDKRSQNRTLLRVFIAIGTIFIAAVAILAIVALWTLCRGL